ncbi:MAG: LamG-like jellyroll fold domain-containing protein, partial [Pseudomonadota bacterium]
VDSTAAHHATDNPAVGAFIYRTNDGTGAFNAYLTKLRWNYADIGAASTDTIEIRLFGIEMVYVPQGAFYAGDGASTSQFRFKQGSSDDDPWYITSENPINVSNVASNGYYHTNTTAGSGEFATGAAFTIPLAFPKGFGGFYIMKGEISQGQWVAFFNTLTSTQKTARDITTQTGDVLTHRNAITWTSGDATNANQGSGNNHAAVAMNFLNSDDLLAYLDWAGLRPMSELEFEKAARGPLTAVAGEYAWGSTNSTHASSITDSGLVTERGQAGSNACYSWGSFLDGPLRVGSFAKGVTTREGSGAGYYGAMELSGNVYERPINISRNVSLAFKGYVHGDGSISSAGITDEAGWPATQDSVGFRGGAWRDGASVMRVSDRIFAAARTTTRNRTYGGRGVRSATGDSVISFNALSGLGTNIEDVFLQGMWNLQDTIGTAATDSSSRARNGTIIGMGSNPTITTGPNSWLPSALDFDGSDDYVDVASNAGVTAFPFTMVSFFRPDLYTVPEAWGAGRAPMSLLNNSANNVYYVLALATTGKMQLLLRNTTYTDTTGTSTISTSNWTHSAAVFESDTSKKLFINGALEATHTTSVTFSSGVNRFLIGRLRTLAGWSPHYWDGGIAGTMVFNRALSKAEINELRLGPEPINTVAPVLSGTATQGQTLSVTTGTWGLDAPFSSGSNGTIYYSYQWTRSDNNSGLNETNISGATSSSYTLAAGDVGKYIRCYVRAGNDGGYDVGPGTDSGFSAVVGGS